MNAYRGVFDFVDDPRINNYRDIDWERWVKQQNAPYGVPRYPTRETCYEAYRTIPQNQTNSVVSDWNFLENVVLEFVQEYRGSPNTNVISEDVFEKVDLSLPNIDKIAILKQLGQQDIRETVRWVYDNLRCGILVSIKYGKIVCFCPFYNPTYENAWAPGFPHGSEAFTNGHLPVRNWWANGGILCTEKYPWGTHFCLQIKDLLAETAHEYLSHIPDITFCVNKRDYPQYKYNYNHRKLVEPYGFIYDADDRDPFQDIPLIDEPAKNVLPMLSFYGTNDERFLDALFPTTEDWEAASKHVYLPDVIYNHQVTLQGVRDLTCAIPENIEPLSSKRSSAFFRGTATGAGTTVFTNQRLRLFAYAQRLNSELLDVKCVGVRQRLHKHFAEPVRTIQTNGMFPVSDQFYTPMSEQYRHKYLIYVEGHCAACRLGMMLASGCVILKIKSLCVASELWFTNGLKEGTSIDSHVVSIRSDLSNLIEKIEFLESHPQIAQQIANNARAFWEEHLQKTRLCVFVAQTLFSFT